MLPLDYECPECEIEMEAVDATIEDEGYESVIFECPECGTMTEFYDEEGETYANEIF